MSDATIDLGEIATTTSRSLARRDDRAETSFDLSVLGHGKISGAYGHLKTDHKVQSLDFLPAGQSRRVPEGTAIKVRQVWKFDNKENVEWQTYYFLEEGRIEGPLAWKDIGQADRRDFELLSKYHRAPKAGYVTGIPVAIGIFATLIGSTEFWADTYEIVSNPIGALAMVTAGACVSAVVGGTLAGAVGAAVSFLIPNRETLVAKSKIYKPLFDRSLMVMPAAPCPDDVVADDIPARGPEIAASLGEELDAALASYHARRHELDDLGVCVQTLDHTARVVDDMHERISKQPRLLRDDDLRNAFLKILARAEADVATQIDKHDATASAGLLSEIRALEQQLDNH